MSHACEGYNDATAGVERLEAMFPDKKIVLVGACMGGQCIVDYLASPHAQTSSVGESACHNFVILIEMGLEDLASNGTQICRDFF